jgi:GNAT superfamily N-acetyltransferase
MVGHDGQIRFRDAERPDVAAIIQLLADDALGKSRESCGEAEDPAYLDAFAAIGRDPNNRLIVADLNGRVIGCMQVTLIQHMTFRGGVRLQIEGVRIDADFRGRQVGAAMFEWAMAFGRERGCHLVQLTTNKGRGDARRFYEKLGFEPSHVGYKCYLR